MILFKEACAIAKAELPNPHAITVLEKLMTIRVTKKERRNSTINESAKHLEKLMGSEMKATGVRELRTKLAKGLKFLK